MQKPILTIYEDPEVVAAQEQNRVNALTLALFLNMARPGEVPMLDIFTTLCDFSYKGDIRMAWGFENKDKVKNIVSGSYEGLLEVYTPMLTQMEQQGLLSLAKDDEGKVSAVKYKYSPDNSQKMFDKIPAKLKYKMKDSVLQLRHNEMKADLEKHLAGVVDITSIWMIMSGLYSTSPLKGIPYLYQKFLKGRKK